MDLDLSKADVGRLEELLMWNWDVFALALLAPGKARHEVHWIEVEGHHPIKVAPCQASLKELVVQWTEIDKMLVAGVV
jgi:hypothetical protein